MASDIVPPQRRLIYVQETKFRYAVSESWNQKQAGSLNLVALRQYSEKEYYLNGPYGDAVVTPVLGLDGMGFFQFDAEIINVFFANDIAGTSGTTEIDVKLATSSGGPFTSIFSTTPKITSAAGNFSFCQSYVISDIPSGQQWTPNPSPPAGYTPAVLNGGAPYPVTGGSAIRVDMIQHMPGAQNFSLIILYRPV